jgi:hypothetical protein
MRFAYCALRAVIFRVGRQFSAENCCGGASDTPNKSQKIILYDRKVKWHNAFSRAGDALVRLLLDIAERRPQASRKAGMER